MHALEKWLKKHGIRYDEWGHDGSKSLSNLWQELKAGEIQLSDNPPLRLVNVVQIVIRQGDFLLVEVEQEFFDGQRRYRDQPPSEKVKPGETIQDAAYRCLQEELGIAPEQILLQKDNHRQHQKKSNSISYPGLPSQYNFHLLEAAVSGLPNEDFWRENLAGDNHIDPVKRHRWAWRPIESFKFITDQ